MKTRNVMITALVLAGLATGGFAQKLEPKEKDKQVRHEKHKAHRDQDKHKEHKDKNKDKDKHKDKAWKGHRK